MKMPRLASLTDTAVLDLSYIVMTNPTSI